MKKVLILFFLVFFILIFAIVLDKQTSSKKKRSQTVSESVILENESEYEHKSDIKENVQSQLKTKSVQIQDIVLKPTNPTVSSLFTVKTSFSDLNTENIRVHFVFWINSEKVKEGKENTLKLKSYKKKDYVSNVMKNFTRGMSVKIRGCFLFRGLCWMMKRKRRLLRH